MHAYVTEEKKEYTSNRKNIIFNYLTIFRLLNCRMSKFHDDTVTWSGSILSYFKLECKCKVANQIVWEIRKI